MALQAGEREVSLSSRGRAYTIDFTAMQQIDDDTGSPSKVLRKECDIARGSSTPGKYTVCLPSLSSLCFLCVFDSSAFAYVSELSSEFITHSFVRTAELRFTDSF